MSELTWVSPAGTVGNLPIGLSVSIDLLAVDTTNNGAQLTYTLISGELPPGMTLDSTTGIISGTPEYSTPSNNYFTTLNYNFIVRVSTTNPLTPQDRSFNLIITNTVNTDFTWITPGGSLGTVPNGEFYQLPLQVSETQANVTTTFSFISGELPPGMQVVSAGYLQGVPTLTTSSAVGTAQDFKFTLRATNSNGHVRDRSFNLSVTNVYGPIIEPSTTSLGSIFDGSYYNQQLTVTEPNPNTTITWSNVGPLPPGITLSSTGLLSGYVLPAVVDTQWGPAGYDAGSDVVAVSATNLVANVIYQIQTVGTSDFTKAGARNNTAGTVFAATGTTTGSGSALIYNTTISAVNIVATQVYQIQSIGSTDFTLFGASSNTIGLVFTATANGYAVPFAGTGTVNQYVNAGTLNSSKQDFDIGPYDFNQISQTKSYSFQIRAYDGANYDLQNYILSVISRSGYTADNTLFTADNTALTVDATNTYSPVLLNTTTILPVGRGGSYYAFKFDGYDFQGDTITYTLSNTVGTFDAYVSGIDGGFDYGGTGTNGLATEDLALTDVGRAGVGFDSFDATGTSKTNLPGLNLDPVTGWIYGKLTPQSSSYVNYKFGIVVSKVRDGITYSSVPIYFSLPVLGDVNNTIKWISPTDLGSIDNGAISDIAIEAISLEGKPLVYTLLDAAGVPIRLPQGLELITAHQNDKYLGLLSGRVTFEAFSLDDYETTIDGGKLTVDRVYTFTVEVATDDATYNADGSIAIPPSATSTQEFTLTLNIIDVKPYNNLYLKAMPAWDQRQIFNSVISNTEIFVPELIYRPTDPWFGVSNDIEMLFLPGLQPDDLNTYANAIIKNHYTKTYTFGDISTAVVLDNNYNVKYEVVYVNVIDPEENSAGVGPAEELDLTNTIANPYVDAQGNDYKIVYPNSSTNMAKQLIGGVGYYDQSSLPPWMTSNQPDPANVNKFTPPLGFTKAVVLAYTIPGASRLIAYRLRNSGINFNRVDFTVDRYLVDDFYTTNFNTTTQAYNSSRETTFDALPNQNIGTLVATVDYAVRVPFDQINGRTVNYINSQGGIDGVTSFKDGDTLVFAQQENFLNAGAYDGWVSYTDAYLGDNILTLATEGYDSESYDPYTIVPGFLELSQSSYTFTGNSQMLSYTLSQTINNPNTAQVYVNGSLVTPGVYTLTSSQLTFQTPPPNVTVSTGSAVIVVYSGPNVQSFNGNGTDTQFTLANSITSGGVTSVVVNGVVQPSANYTIVGSTLTFVSAPQPVLHTLPPTIKIVNSSTVNQRGGVWQINIIGEFVILTPVLQVQLNQRIRVFFGQTYGGAILYYNPILNPGQTVPSYSVFKLQTNVVAHKTTFNANTTRFFN